MNRHRMVFLSLLMLMAAHLANAQAPGVHSEYMKDNKTTRVETNLLYLLNTPDQFVELILRSWYKGETLSKAPTRVALEIFSLSKKPLYEGNKALTLVADGEELPIGSVSNLVLTGETKNGADTFYGVRGNPNVGMQVPVPQSAEIKLKGNGVSGLSLEWMEIDIKPEQFFKLAKSKTMALRLGKSSFTFTEAQMNIIRNFATAITLQ